MAALSRRLAPHPPQQLIQRNLETLSCFITLCVCRCLLTFVIETLAYCARPALIFASLTSYNTIGFNQIAALAADDGSLHFHIVSAFVEYEQLVTYIKPYLYSKRAALLWLAPPLSDIHTGKYRVRRGRGGAHVSVKEMLRPNVTVFGSDPGRD